jgi:alkanesulfonate monooxygenase SsuD/methylene tetrahydromethanopterin reductase-like flavin-dependent oxidoreductase (luciferase family)
MTRMDYGLDIGFMNGEFTARVAPVIEALGYQSVWEGEHVVGFPHYDSRYPYTPEGDANVLTAEGRAEGFDSFQQLVAVALQTTRLRIGTGVTILPQRNPLYLAQSVTTIDVFSNGRFNLGIGLGWFREEFGAVDGAVRKAIRTLSRVCERDEEPLGGRHLRVLGQPLPTTKLPSVPEARSASTPTALLWRQQQQCAPESG